jgi:uncharacterized metal-binding protein YceD (DUF177 family)
MSLPAIASLTCRFRLERDLGGSLVARGQLFARVVQTCVVTLDDFAATVAESFAVRCVPEGKESDDPDPDSMDELVYAGGTIDLGEAAVEQLALALDPYPRAPGAELPALEADPEPHRFADLEALKRRH